MEIACAPQKSSVENLLNETNQTNSTLKLVFSSNLFSKERLNSSQETPQTPPLPIQTKNEEEDEEEQIIEKKEKEKEGPNTRSHNKRKPGTNSSKPPTKKIRKEETTKELQDVIFELPETDIKIGSRWFYRGLDLLKNNKILCSPSVGVEVSLYGVHEKKILVGITCSTRGSYVLFWMVDQKGDMKKYESKSIKDILSFGNEIKADTCIFDQFLQYHRDLYDPYGSSSNSPNDKSGSTGINSNNHPSPSKRKRSASPVSSPYIFTNNSREYPLPYTTSTLQILQEEMKKRNEEFEKMKIENEFLRKEITNLKKENETLRTQYLQSETKASRLEGEVKVYEKFTKILQSNSK